ncbi:multisubunit sodium/proton antiporter, MrpA subunit [Rubritalea squalenifaciens DSM 18772]|uniref:Multisubunit sodium/proton antiporter, MrpA subunit n=1 Tax=Rubritalea squalenifaciens DSM 18772 TaxID=1123071 RepID=A0A1M6DRM1_9BACT|nr:hydrogen gas-evolving membrane-bound hydrogenase subunit E [Rubritalea squalenifaciens]SHI75894.1 multisubunit sodium/proton antiporter, MrpA subunit [Rubritalea squalenifaciens DSM 18772]
MPELLPCILLLLLLPCFIIPALGSFSSSRFGWLMCLPAFAAFFLLLKAAPGILDGQPVEYRVPWVPLLNVDFSLHLSGIRLVLALLVTGIGGFIQLYAYGYMHGPSPTKRMAILLYLFMFAMAGVCLADHMIVFFIFWEITSVSSYLLIGFNHADKISRRNALQALLVTGLGGVSLLLGFIMMASVTGVWHLSEISAFQPQLVSSSFYPAILTLVLLGAFTKSAQFPFHFWLPNAMAAPTPVSAYLHSATMVKAGVFLLFLMTPILGMTTAWSTALLISGGITFFLGGAFGFVQNDLKKILAGSTLAILGMITFLIGIGGSKAILAAVLVLLAHAFYKASLFMIAGCVDHSTGTRDIQVLGGLKKAMPLTALAAALAGLSMSGLPPFLGFIGKEYALKAALYSPDKIILLSTIIVSSMLIVGLALKAAYKPFWGTPQAPKEDIHESSTSMLLGPLILSCLGILTGLLPFTVSQLVISSTDQLSTSAYKDGIHLWSGFNLPLLLSTISIGLGITLYAFRDKVTPALAIIKPQSFDSLYEGTLNAILKFASKLTTGLQSGFLRHYIIIIILSTFVLIYQKLITFGVSNIFNSALPWNIPVVVITILMLGAILVAVNSRSRLTTLVALGLIGYGVAFLFMEYSAPDLAITQILVETLTVVLFASVVRKLPDHKPLSSTRSKIYDLTLSIAFGTMITLLVLKSNSLNLGHGISDAISRLSYPEGKGSNIVNVILVDFRALDTWGEICVLAIASLGAASILNTGIRKREK